MLVFFILLLPLCNLLKYLNILFTLIVDTLMTSLNNMVEQFLMVYRIGNNISILGINLMHPSDSFQFPVAQKYKLPSRGSSEQWLILVMVLMRVEQ